MEKLQGAGREWLKSWNVEPLVLGKTGHCTLLYGWTFPGLKCGTIFNQIYDRASVQKGGWSGRLVVCETSWIVYKVEASV